MDKVLQNLNNIKAWVDFNSPPPDFGTNTEFIKFAVEIMNRCLYLLKTGAASVPDAETAIKRYAKNEAIIVGHMVRITKLYEGFLMHICSHQQELAHIFFRLILETAIRMEYLITSESPKESFQSFILTSYRPEKEMLQDLENNAKQEQLIPIQERMRRSIISWLREDGITHKELLKNKNWNLDGKNFREIMKTFNLDSMYSYGFGLASHQVHGDWLDIAYYHLREEEKQCYTPDLFFTEPDPRLTCSLTHICLDSVLKYLKWNNSDPDNIICHVVEKLCELNLALDAAHESRLSEEYNLYARNGANDKNC